MATNCILSSHKTVNNYLLIEFASTRIYLVKSFNTNQNL